LRDKAHPPPLPFESRWRMNISEENSLREELTRLLARSDALLAEQNEIRQQIESILVRLNQPRRVSIFDQLDDLEPDSP
jgi:hypothetical protein